jgi:hypothetical protein
MGIAQNFENLKKILLFQKRDKICSINQSNHKFFVAIEKANCITGIFFPKRDRLFNIHQIISRAELYI